MQNLKINLYVDILPPAPRLVVWNLNRVAALHKVGQQAVWFCHEVAELALLGHGPALQNRHAVRLRIVCKPMNTRKDDRNRDGT